MISVAVVNRATAMSKTFMRFYISAHFRVLIWYRQRFSLSSVNLTLFLFVTSPPLKYPCMLKVANRFAQFFAGFLKLIKTRISLSVHAHKMNLFTVLCKSFRRPSFCLLHNSWYLIKNGTQLQWNVYMWKSQTSANYANLLLVTLKNRYAKAYMCILCFRSE